MPSYTPRIDSLQASNNLCINGNFDFWQRGTSAAFTSSSPNTYLADRWSANIGTAGYTITTSRSTDVPTLAQSGFQSTYSHLITNGTAPSLAAGDNNSIAYKMEGHDYASVHGKKFRIQLWIKTSIAGTYSLSLRNSSAARSYVTPLVISAANTWEKKTFDIQSDTSGTWLFDNGIGLRAEIYHTCGSTLQTSNINQWQTGNYVGITGQTQLCSTTGATMQIVQVMFIPGDFSSTTDIPFKRAGKTISDELEVCQRYYEKSYGVGVNPATATADGACARVAINGNDFYTGDVYFRVKKRSVPAITIYNSNNGGTGQASEYTLGPRSLVTNRTNMISQNVNDSGFEVLNNGSNLAGGRLYYFQWAADIEL